ncbi:MAG: hypothetical protein P1V34_05890 [Alphaproteobacteria bacterium]|nr:hypothetical protein [Alphaproteobacteria bacterium]
MNIAGVDANTILLAQSSYGQKQGPQEAAAVEQRSRDVNIQEVAQKRQAEAPQSQNAVTAIETSDAGRTAILRRPTLPRDAQTDAQALLTATPQAGSSPPPRGSVVNIYA